MNEFDVVVAYCMCVCGWVCSDSCGCCCCWSVFCFLLFRVYVCVCVRLWIFVNRQQQCNVEFQRRGLSRNFFCMSLSLSLSLNNEVQNWNHLHFGNFVNRVIWFIILILCCRIAHSNTYTHTPTQRHKTIGYMMERKSGEKWEITPLLCMVNY